MQEGFLALDGSVQEGLPALDGTVQEGFLALDGSCRKDFLHWMDRAGRISCTGWTVLGIRVCVCVYMIGQECQGGVASRGEDFLRGDATIRGSRSKHLSVCNKLVLQIGCLVLE